MCRIDETAIQFFSALGTFVKENWFHNLSLMKLCHFTFHLSFSQDNGNKQIDRFILMYTYDKFSFISSGGSLPAILPSPRSSWYEAPRALPPTGGEHEDNPGRDQGPLLLPTAMVHVVLRGWTVGDAAHETPVGGVSSRQGDIRHGWWVLDW